MLTVVFLLMAPGGAWARPEGGGPEGQDIIHVVDSLQWKGEIGRTAALVDSALAVARARGDKKMLGRLILEKSAMLNNTGETVRALALLYEALGLERATGDSLGLAQVLNSIGTIQHGQKNYGKAGDYYRRSGAIYKRLGLKREVGKYWNNLGALEEDMGKPMEAIANHRRSLGIWQALGDTGWAALSYMHLGTCYGQIGKFDSARYYLRRSMHDQGPGSQGYLMVYTKVTYGMNEVMAGRLKAALPPCKEGLAMAKGLHMRFLEQQACDCLYKVYDGLGKKARALDYFRRSVSIRDSLFGEANVKAMTRIEMNHEFAQKQLADSLIRAKRQVEEELVHQAEVTKERNARNLALYGIIAVLVLAAGLWSRLRFLRLSRARVLRERNRSERLLLNILPEAVTQELKDHGEAMAREYPRATILFSDFKNFTRITQTMSAQALVEELDHCFKAFDRIMATHEIEKIKTIGDAYMCVGGLPGLAPATPVDVVQAALKMQEFVSRRKLEREAKGLVPFTMRVGIHTGPVVAGVVGLRKFSFDIWGDAVNTASAMETAGESGKVNISRTTYELVKNEPGLSFIQRGKVQAKGKGEMEMYFVEGAWAPPPPNR